ncbi:MAG: hypothetical protein QOG72_2451 [Sphingomonadales bacterium]|jgi:hypothetical protein|nr:hypothetical protein [Sphingomonadales bacterium]
MIPPRRLNSPGPVAAEFLQSRAFICGIIGPVGSGKTLTALQKGLRVGALQGGKVDDKGVTWRTARVGVIRESYPNLEANTLKSWWNIVPEEEGKFSWKAPYVHSFRKVLRREGGQRDGRPIDVLDMQVEFRAIGDRSVEEVTRGWEVNAVIVDEFDLQPPDLVSFLSGRVGRFSSLDPSLVVDPQIILSLNAPYTDNHAYKLLIEKDLGELDDPELIAALEGRPLVECFIQPGGREPDAENIHNLRGGRGYYVLQAAANKHRVGYVERMLDNKFVPMQHGQPVNPGFKYSEHVRADLEWDPRRKLIVAVDQGLFAAAVASQRTVMGQLRTLRETVLMREEGKSLLKIGPTTFGQMVRQMLNDNFPDLRPEMLRVVADPAAFAADDREDNEQDWILAFRTALNIGRRRDDHWFVRVHKAKSNRQALRNEAIWRALAERDGYAVHPSCKHLIRGHLGGYHYRKAELPAASGEVRGHLEIADTIYTHVCDAEQYAALEGEHVIGDIRGKARRGEGRRIVNDSDYAILGG